MPATTYGAKIKKRRQALDLGLERATSRANHLLPEEDWRSYGYLNRIELGDITDDEVDIPFVAALCKSLDISLDQLGPRVVQRANELLDLLKEVTGEGFKKRGNSTLSNHTGPGDNLRNGRRPMSPQPPSVSRAA